MSESLFWLYVKVHMKILSATQNLDNEKIKETKRKRKTLYDSATAIKRFKAAVREGTYYICVICNRCFFKRSVKCFHVGKYKSPDKPFFYIAHVDSFEPYVSLGSLENFAGSLEHKKYQSRFQVQGFSFVHHLVAI